MPRFTLFLTSLALLAGLGSPAMASASSASAERRASDAVAARLNVSTTSSTARCLDRVVSKRMARTNTRSLVAACGVDRAGVAVLQRQRSLRAAERAILRHSAIKALASDADGMAVKSKRIRDGWLVVAAVATMPVTPAMPTASAQEETAAPAPAPEQASAVWTPDPAATGIIRSTNAQRAAVGLGALRANKCLSDLAAKHAAELVAAEKLYHSNLYKVQEACNVTRLVAENVLYNQSGAADYAVQQWMNSPSHRVNMLLPNAGIIGVAQIFDPATGRYYAVQIFGGGIA